MLRYAKEIMTVAFYLEFLNKRITKICLLHMSILIYISVFSRYDTPYSVPLVPLKMNIFNLSEL